MLPWHGAFHDPAVRPRHPAAHHQFVTGVQLLHEGRDTAEIVAIIGVTNDDPSTLCRGYSPPQGAAVPSLCYLDHTRTCATRNFLRTIRAAIVRNHHLARDGELYERVVRFTNADGQRFRLVETRHYDGEL